MLPAFRFTRPRIKGPGALDIVCPRGRGVAWPLAGSYVWGWLRLRVAGGVKTVTRSAQRMLWGAKSFVAPSLRVATSVVVPAARRARYTQLCTAV
jgi:hypothetical protein